MYCVVRQGSFLPFRGHEVRVHFNRANVTNYHIHFSSLRSVRGREYIPEVLAGFLMEVLEKAAGDRKYNKEKMQELMRKAFHNGDLDEETPR